MSRLIALTATALALTLAAPAAVLADPGNGKGGDRQERGNRGGDDNRGGRGGGDDDDRGNGRGPARDQARDQARGGEARGEARGALGQARGEARAALAEARAARGEAHGDRDGRDRDDDRRDDRRELRRTVEREVFQTRDGNPVVYFRGDRDRGLIAGCPPGLAKKNNGCVPPGLARQAARAAGVDRYESLWRRSGDNARYRYEDGHLYRMNQQGSLLGYLPVLGGALAPGATWPSQFAYQPAPDYYSRYFGLAQGQDYRYADGALYGVDPRTQTISQVAALLTGQNLSVGQPMPSGYDVYNVPYQYRNQYADNANEMYRYNDGYVYQADPKTQLVTAVIQLLT